MAFNILAGTQYVQQQGEEGRQRGQGQFAAKLLGEAYNSTGAARQDALGRLAGRQPQVAMAADQQFRQQDAQMTEEAFARLQTHAKMIQSVPAEQRANVWAQIQPRIAQELPEYAQYLPSQWDEAAVMPVVEQLASMGDASKTSVTPSLAAVERAYAQGLISPEEYSQAVKVAIDLAPGASAPGISYIDQWDPVRQQMVKVPTLTRGLDYTGNAPTLGGTMPPAGSTQPPQSAPQPGTRDFQIDASQADEPFPTDPSEAAAAQMALTSGGTFIVGPDGRPKQVGASGADLTMPRQPPPRPPVAPPQRQTLDRIPLDQYGAGDERMRRPLGNAVLGGPSGAEKIEQQRLEAAAGAQGRIEGERAAGPNFEQESSLRKEYLAAVSAPKVVISAFDKVKSASTSGTAAGDMSMIFAYMKMLDPGSTVREGEYASARDTTGVPGQILNLYNKAKDGQFLSPQQRSAFVAEAQKIAASAQASLDETNAYYSDIAPKYGIDPSRVIRADGKKPPADEEIYEPGDVIELGGKRYRALTGGPDPDLEEI